MTGRPLTIVGDTLLDRDLDGRVERVAPDAPVPVVDEPAETTRPGGAGLAAVLAAQDGRDVTLVTALAPDDGGREVRGLLEHAGVRVVDLRLDGRTPEKVRVRGDGHPLVRLDRGGTGRVGNAGDDVHQALLGAAAVLVADYGRGVAAERSVRAALGALPARVPVIWDPHPRGADPVPGVRLATPNRAESERFAPDTPGDGLPAVSARARTLAARWRAAGVAVTIGRRGAVLVEGSGLPLVVPAPVVHGGDPCGAGDRFATAAAGLLADGALPSEAVTGAVTLAAAFVAAGGAASVRVGAPHETTTTSAADPTTRPSSADDVIARVRAAGGTVVATGGCFDLLHAGHVQVLETARSLGDCLVVCLNDDESVRRLKGEGRPLNRVEDRAAVLAALGCVDAVAVFGEDTPVQVLERLRPDVWAKGADYTAADVPEAAVLARWGGQAVLLPYVAGHSTSRIVEEVARRVAD